MNWLYCRVFWWVYQAYRANSSIYQVESIWGFNLVMLMSWVNQSSLTNGYLRVESSWVDLTRYPHPRDLSNMQITSIGHESNGGVWAFGSGKEGAAECRHTILLRWYYTLISYVQKYCTTKILCIVTSFQRREKNLTCMCNNYNTYLYVLLCLDWIATMNRKINEFSVMNAT
jgi:hypothetical protein